MEVIPPLVSKIYDWRMRDGRFAFLHKQVAAWEEIEIPSGSCSSLYSTTQQDYKHDAGHLKSVGSWHKDNSQKVLTTTTSLRRYGLIEVFRKHSSLILCFPIFNQSNIGEDSKILNYSGMVIFEVTFAKPCFWCVLCKQNEIGWLQMPGTIGLFPQVQPLPPPNSRQDNKYCATGWVCFNVTLSLLAKVLKTDFH